MPTAVPGSREGARRHPYLDIDIDGKAAERPYDFRAEKVAEFRRKFASPYIAARRGFIDEVIEPRVTRAKLVTGLRMLANKRDCNPPRKHGNIPL